MSCSSDKFHPTVKKNCIGVRILYSIRVVLDCLESSIANYDSTTAHCFSTMEGRISNSGVIRKHTGNTFDARNSQESDLNIILQDIIEGQTFNDSEILLKVLSAATYGVIRTMDGCRAFVN